MAYMDVKPTGTPNGQTVVLLHGFNFFGEAWAGTIDVLTREGFRVIVPDQIGFGRSSKPFIPYTFNDMAHNTRRLLQSLGVDRAAIVGHSMGGMLASRFAMLYPDGDDARRDGESDRSHRRAAGARAALSRRRLSHRLERSAAEPIVRAGARNDHALLRDVEARVREVRAHPLGMDAEPGLGVVLESARARSRRC